MKTEQIKQLIERQKKEFDEKFEAWIDGQPLNIFKNLECFAKVKSFHSQSLKDILDAVIEMEEKRYIDFSKKSKKAISKMDEGDIGYMHGTNDTISNTIATLQALKEML